MPDRPKLSICVPSRNRQDCFRQTILDLTADPRGDTEFVFADNSDDPAIMDGFMRDRDDPRVTYLPSQATALSMADNWERVLDAATGEWVAIIGDDDFIAPDLADYILEIEARSPDTGAIGWNRVPFEWPEARTEAKSTPFSLANHTQRHTHEQIMVRLFGWLAATYLPQCPYGIYHGAIPRRTLDAMRHRFPGPYFDHPMVDYNFMHKLLHTTEDLVYINRPMSVLGVAKSSNSAAVGRQEASERASAAYLKEGGNATEEANAAAGFPFDVQTGVTGAIMAAQFWFKQKHAIRYEGWEENFARAMSAASTLWPDRQEFERHVAACEAAFDAWDGGRYRHLFKPVFRDASDRPPFAGVHGGDLYVRQDVGGASTPAAFHAVLRSILPEPAAMEYAL